VLHALFHTNLDEALDFHQASHSEFYVYTLQLTQVRPSPSEGNWLWMAYLVYLELAADMITRTVKQLLRDMQRRTHSSAPSLHRALTYIANFLNNVTGFEGCKMWTSLIVPGVISRFGYWSLTSIEKENLYSVVVSCGMLPKIVVGALQGCGIRIKPNTLSSFIQKPINFRFVARDVVMEGRVKQMSIIETANGIAYGRESVAEFETYLGAPRTRADLLSGVVRNLPLALKSLESALKLDSLNPILHQEHLIYTAILGVATSLELDSNESGRKLSGAGRDQVLLTAVDTALMSTFPGERNGRRGATAAELLSLTSKLWRVSFLSRQKGAAGASSEEVLMAFMAKVKEAQKLLQLSGEETWRRRLATEVVDLLSLQADRTRPEAEAEVTDLMLAAKEGYVARLKAMSRLSSTLLVETTKPTSLGLARESTAGEKGHSEDDSEKEKKEKEPGFDSWVTALLGQNFAVGCVDKFGNNAAHMIASAPALLANKTKGQCQSLQLLKREGLDLKAKNNVGRTPLDTLVALDTKSGGYADVKMTLEALGAAVI